MRMRCACLLACSAKWVAAGQRVDGGGGWGGFRVGGAAPQTYEKGNARWCLCEKCGANGGRMGRNTWLPFGMTQRLKAKKILRDGSNLPKQG